MQMRHLFLILVLLFSVSCGGGDQQTPILPSEPSENVPSEPNENTPSEPNEDEKDDSNILSVPLDSRWEFTASMASDPNFSWLTEKIFYATSGEGKDKATISAHSANGKEIICDVSDTYGEAVSVGGLLENDYILFSVPVENLPAGTDVDFMVLVNVTKKTLPKDWAIEYFEDGAWKAMCNPVEIKSYSPANVTNIIKSFRTEKIISQSELKIRMRVCSNNATSGQIPSDGGAGRLIFGPNVYQSARILIYPNEKFAAVKDTKKILILGNSSTYYYASQWMLKEIARSQGQQIDMRVNTRSGYSFAQHLKLSQTQALIAEGGYDAAIIQDLTTNHSKYYSDPDEREGILNPTIELRDAILATSPACKIYLENTTAYPKNNYMGFGSIDAFYEALSEGCQMVAKEAGLAISPICEAYVNGMKAGYSLSYTDNAHPSVYGAYLKSCVNYLNIYRTRFDENVSDCDLPASTAKALRQIAEDVVFMQ